MSKKIKLHKLKGKKVTWRYAEDHKRGTYLEDSGIVTDVEGRNIEIDGTWHYAPDLSCLEVA